MNDIKKEIMFDELQDIMIELINTKYSDYNIIDAETFCDKLLKQNRKKIKELFDYNHKDLDKTANTILDVFLRKTLANDIEKNISNVPEEGISNNMNSHDESILSFEDFIINEDYKPGKNTLLLLLKMISNFKNITFKIENEMFKNDNIDSFIISNMIGEDYNTFLELIENRRSLSKIYTTLKNNSEKSRFYIKLNNYTIEYGLVSENELILCGTLKINRKDFLTKICVFKSFDEIREDLLDIKLKNTAIFNRVLKDLNKLLNNIQYRLEKPNNNTLCVVYDLSIFYNYENLNNNTIGNFIINWARNKKWFNKCFIHTTIEDSEITIVVRVK